MKPREILAELIDRNGTTKYRLAKKLSVNPIVFQKKFRKTNVKIAEFVRLCELLGYEVVVQPKRAITGPRPKEQIIVEAEEEDVPENLKAGGEGL